MAGVLCALAASGGIAVVVTVGSDGFFDPKSGNGANQYGYSNSANAISGVAFGAVSPTSIMGATINALYFQDDFSTGAIVLLLNGNQSALPIARIVINGTTYVFGAASVFGGQTSWSASAPVGNGWGGSPSTARIS